MRKATRFCDNCWRTRDGQPGAAGRRTLAPRDAGRRHEGGRRSASHPWLHRLPGRPSGGTAGPAHGQRPGRGGRQRRPRGRRSSLPTVLNNLAYADLIIGDPELLAEADEASTRALGGREAGAFLDTRAWALIETGQVSAGARLAHRALNDSTGRGRAHTQCVLALAAARSGEADRARTFLAAAAGVLPTDDPVLRRIRRSVAVAEPPVAQLVEP
jgi:hypothetical protein